jgi:SAM-dependent methyltransferase
MYYGGSMGQVRNPREIALDAHRNYYSGGTYGDDRLIWTVDTFLSADSPGKILEVGCGDGAMLRLLAGRGMDATGVDASSTGIKRCRTLGLDAQCLDVSSDGLPFEDNLFDTIISLETFEHLMNPYYVLQEVRRVLRPSGRFLCSVPNPLTGHPYLYPGLFEYNNFRRFLEQSGFSVDQVRPWQWAPRETIFPVRMRNIPVLQGRFVAGGIRRMIEASWRAAGVFPYFCYWLWTFDCRNRKERPADPYRATVELTRPGPAKQFVPET